MVRAADRRADRVPYEYEAKTKRADEAFGAPGSTADLAALMAIPTIRGTALGAFGEFSESINVLIQGFAHEGALSRTPTNSARATTRQLMEKSTGG
jgi:hypothetical protein